MRSAEACRRNVGHAAQLAKTHAPQVVVFSGWAPNGGIPEAEQMLALWQGPWVELVLEPTASTTAENAARTLPLLWLTENIRHAVIVCAPLHLYRARWFFRRLYSARGIETRFHDSHGPAPAVGVGLGAGRDDCAVAAAS